MKDWENRLCFRATNRVVRPFDWGLEWTGDWPAARKRIPVTVTLPPRICAF